jgi:hypothetical protein
MKLGGQETVILPYDGGILSIHIIKHGVYWRIIAKFSTDDVKIDDNNLHITNDGHPLDFCAVDEFGHKIVISGEKTVKHRIIYFDVNKDDYKIGDRIEFIISKGFIDGVDYAIWPITES